MRNVPARPGRRGVAAVWALVILIVLTALMANITWLHLAGRRVLDQRHRQLQAEWLARAGLELAAARLLANPAGYSGETVTLLPASEVRILVQPEAGSRDRFQVTSTATYPTDDKHPVSRP